MLISGPPKKKQLGIRHPTALHFILTCGMLWGRIPCSEAQYNENGLTEKESICLPERGSCPEPSTFPRHGVGLTCGAGWLQVSARPHCNTSVTHPRICSAPQQLRSSHDTQNAATQLATCHSRPAGDNLPNKQVEYTKQELHPLTRPLLRERVAALRFPDRRASSRQKQYAVQWHRKCCGRDVKALATRSDATRLPTLPLLLPHHLASCLPRWSLHGKTTWSCRTGEPRPLRSVAHGRLRAGHHLFIWISLPLGERFSGEPEVRHCCECRPRCTRGSRTGTSGNNIAMHSESDMKTKYGRLIYAAMDLHMK